MFDSSLWVFKVAIWGQLTPKLDKVGSKLFTWACMSNVPLQLSSTIFTFPWIIAKRSDQ